MATVVETNSQLKEPGFSVREGANWSEYLAFRPLYPVSFFNRIYEYHSQKLQAANSTAHDVGAGCGIVSSTLASRFNKVIVSDPNDGYATLARKLLVEESGIPESKFKFLQEGVEKSSVESGVVDLITACEMMHWTNTDAAIKEFGRELKPGGTLALTFYTVPRIVENEEAQKIWRAIWRAYAERAQGDLYDHAFRIGNSGFQHVGFPHAGWERVTRLYINSGGNIEPFKIDDRMGESRVRDTEETVWVEGDQDWSDVQGVDWLKGYLATWVPRLPESDIQHLWDGMETALDGKKASLQSPIVMVFATKKA